MPSDKITVLLVDDHTVVRDGVRLMLSTALTSSWPVKRYSLWRNAHDPRESVRRRLG